MKAVGFSRETAERILQAVDAVEAAPTRLATEPGRRASIDVYHVQLTSLTTVSGRYPGKRYTYDPSSSTWTAHDDVWVIEANGTALALSTKYPAYRNAVANGRPVWVVSVAAGVASINGDTTAAQVISGPDGTVSVDSVATPGTTALVAREAGSGVSGILSTGTQTISGAKSFEEWVTALNGYGFQVTGAGVSSLSTTDYAGVVSHTDIGPGLTMQALLIPYAASGGLMTAGFYVSSTGDNSYPSYGIKYLVSGVYNYARGAWTGPFSGGLYIGGSSFSVPLGGTGAASFTSGALVYGNGTSALGAAVETRIVSDVLEVKTASDSWIRVGEELI